MRALLLPLLLMSPPPTVVAPDGHGFASASGTILENVRGCQRDAACQLRLGPAPDGGEVHIVYHHGEGEQRCASEELTRRAIALSAGARVHAYGRYARRGKSHELDVCAPANARLQLR